MADAVKTLSNLQNNSSQDQTKALASLKKAATKLNSAGGQNPQYGALAKPSSTLDQLKNLILNNPATNVLGTAVSEVERPAQAVLRGIENRDQGLSGVLHGIGEGLAGSNHGFVAAPTESINLAQAVGAPIFEKAGYTRQQAEAETQSLGGKLGAIANFAGGTALDPLSYATLGVSGIAKAGLKSVAATAGEDVAKQVAAGGVRSLAPEAKETLRAQLTTTDAAKNFAAAKAGRTVEDYADNILHHLNDPIGAKFAGKTVLPYASLKSAAAKGADTTGLSGVASAVKAAPIIQNTLTPALHGLQDTFKVAAGVGRELGEGARNGVQRSVAAALTTAGIKKSDSIRQIADAAKGVKDAPNFIRYVASPALENGTRDTLIADLRAQGKDSEANLVDTLHNVLQKGLTKQRLESGVLKPSQVRDTDIHFPLVVTPEGQRFIEQHPAEAELLGHKVQANSVIRHSEAKIRSTDETTAEINQRLAERTGVPEFYHENALEAFQAQLNKVHHETFMSNLLDRLTKEVHNGQPLAIRAPSAEDKIKSIRQVLKTGTSEIDKEIVRVKNAIAQERTKEAVHGVRSKAALAARDSAKKEVDSLRSKVEKLTDNPSKIAAKQLVSAKQKLVEAEKNLATADSRLQRLASTAPESSAFRLQELQDARKTLKETAKSSITNAKQRAAFKPPAGYIKINAGPKGSFYAPRSITKHLLDLESEGSSRKSGTLLNGLSSLQAAWKNIQLNFGPFALARIERDAQSNLVQMVEEGFTDFSAFKPALRITRVLTHISSGKSLAAAIEDSNLTATEKKYIEEAQKQGLLEGGQFSSSELAHSNAALSQKGRLAKALDVRKAEGSLTKTAQSINDFSDKFSRMAMFIDQFRKHGDAREAANAADRALFNYNDLTSQEKLIRKYGMAFYTFSRKNNVLQLRTLARDPRKLAALERSRESLAASSDGKHPLPDYALAGGEVPLGSIGGTDIVGGLQTPDIAAEQSIQPLVDILSNLPGTPEKTRTIAGLRGGFADLVGNFSGVGPDALKQMASEAAGSDLYTGSPLKPTDSDVLQRWAAAFLPRYNAYQTELSGAQGADAEKAVSALKLLGVSAFANTAKRQTGTLKGQLASIQQAAARQGLTKKASSLETLKQTASAKK